MVIIIYSKDEVKNFKKTKEIEKQVTEKCIQKDDTSLTNDACIEENKKNNNNLSTKININSATLEELMTLPGIGESKAKSIIKYREEDSYELSNIASSISLRYCFFNYWYHFILAIMYGAIKFMQ